MVNVSFILGTRPEAIKLAPLILSLQQDESFKVEVCSTGQHKEMLYQVLNFFGITPDIDLELMRPNQDLVSLNALALSEVDRYLKKTQPSLVVVQGDTTTVLAASMAAFYNKIPVAHVEAGLRTFNKYSPFPEEMNRVVTSRLAGYHFAPTETSKDNLLNEGINAASVFITGNTVIDALLLIRNKIADGTVSVPDWINLLQPNKCILVTGHRRENFGEGIQSICEALIDLGDKYPDYKFIYPVHLNPNIQKPVQSLLSGRPNIELIAPLDYVSFIALMDKSYLILTDSGGVQEEAPSLGKPVLVMRENSERPEAITAGTVKLVGTHRTSIVKEVSNLIVNRHEYHQMAKAINPYGDGKASARICNILKEKMLAHAVVGY